MAVAINSPLDTYNKLAVNNPLTINQTGYVGMAAIIDEGTVTGSRLARAAKITEDYRLRVSTDSVLFQDAFVGSAINTALWSQAVTTFTIAVANGYMTLNSGAVTTANAVARVQSYRTFPMYARFTSIFENSAIYDVAGSVPIANVTAELGVGFATGTAAPTDGAFFRYNAAGTFECVVVYNGAGTSQVVAAPSVNVLHRYTILLGFDGTIEFWIDDVLQCVLLNTVAGVVPNAFSSPEQPILFRLYNGAVAPASAVRLRVGAATTGIGDQGAARPWNYVLAGQGAGLFQGQTGWTMGSTANYANSAAPAAATLSNTAAGYAAVGGQYLFTTVAGAETDYALFAFQIPVGSSVLPGKTAYITGVRISAVNIGAAVATTPTVLQWSLGVGSTAVSLAQAEGAGTKARRVIPLGVQSFVVGAAIGASAPDINVQFQGPVPVETGTFIHVILKMPIGTATASQQIRGVVAIDGLTE